jgi:hypothetical protein
VLIVIGPGYLEVLVRLDLDPVLPRGDAGVIFKCEVVNAFLESATEARRQPAAARKAVAFSMCCSRYTARPEVLI